MEEERGVVTAATEEERGVATGGVAGGRGGFCAFLTGLRVMLSPFCLDWSECEEEEEEEEESLVVEGITSLMSRR